MNYISPHKILKAAVRALPLLPAACLLGACNVQPTEQAQMPQVKEVEDGKLPEYTAGLDAQPDGPADLPRVEKPEAALDAPRLMWDTEETEPALADLPTQEPERGDLLARDGRVDGVASNSP